jgi:cob(I)alamin adenosyltransferase
MSISTGTGDDGTTGLFYGGRVGKDDPGPEAYGTVDEAVSVLGIARAAAEETDPGLAAEILRLQRALFVVAAELATAPTNRHKLVPGETLTTPEMVTSLESELDQVIAARGAPTAFVVPGGTRQSAALDHARTVIRRAERRAVSLAGKGGLPDSSVVPYLNRLADYVYMLARRVEDEWTPSKAEEGS